jgi:hypothetical protein
MRAEGVKLPRPPGGNGYTAENAENAENAEMSEGQRLDDITERVTGGAGGTSPVACAATRLHGVRPLLVTMGL